MCCNNSRPLVTQLDSTTLSTAPPVRLGDLYALPAAVTSGMVGMREGGRRRILVPPQLGWTSDKVGWASDDTCSAFGAAPSLA